jgi:hypothetical protein
VHDRAHVTEFGKPECTSHEAPDLGVRLDETEGISALALPARSSCEPLEAALPRLIELDQELCTNVARYVGEKRELGAERFQLVDLVESVRIETKGTRQAELSLLEGKVPQEAERGLPGKQALLLPFARVDPKLEPLMTPHQKNIL